MMIGERLRELRKDRGLTQEQLAKELYINFRTYSGYEREESEASDDVKIKIAQYFNVSLDYLLGLTQEAHPIDIGVEYVRLPFQFSTEAHKDLKLYINFLAQKDNLNKS